MTITYTNANGESLTLRQRKPFFLQRVDGTGIVKNAVNTFKAPLQDGAFFISGSLEMRNITLEGTVVGATADDAYAARKRLLRVFTPKLKGTLRYRGSQIPCIVEEVGFIAGVRERVPSFFISLLCPSPFFEALEELRVELASWAPALFFPLEIPSAGLQFGIRQPSQIISVENDGDVPCGCEVVFLSLGTVTNPELRNVDTGEFVRLLTTLNANEEYRIFTHFAGKRVVKVSGSTESNAFHLLDTDSTFFQLIPGANTLRYDAATNIELLEVRLYYRPQYLGV